MRLRAHRVESEEGKERNKADEPVEVTLEKSEEGLLVKIGVGPVVKGLHEGAHAAQINPNPPAVVLLRRHAEKHRRETPYRVVLRVRGVGDRPVWVARRRGEAGAGFRRTREDGKEGFRIDHPLLAEPLVGAGGKKSRVGVARSDGVQHFGGVVRAPEKSAEKVVRFVPFFHKTAAQPLPGPERHAALQGEALSAQILPILWGGFLRRNEKKRSGRSRRALADSLARRQGHRPRVEHERDGRARRRHGEGNLALPHFLHEDARRNPLDDYASVGKGVLQGVENGKNALIEDGGRPRILHGDPKVTRSGSLCGHGIDRKNRGNLSFAKFERTKGRKVEACRRDGVGRGRFFGGERRRRGNKESEGEKRRNRPDAPRRDGFAASRKDFAKGEMAETVHDGEERESLGIMTGNGPRRKALTGHPRPIPRYVYRPIPRYVAENSTRRENVANRKVFSFCTLSTHHRRGFK